jgi:acetyltransferase-like isoleucine patch superfamily enzyme
MTDTSMMDSANGAAPFVHPHAIVESARVGPRTRVWAFAHVLPGARIGADCNICDGVFIENDVLVGDRVTVKCGVQLWDGVTLEDDVFVGPNATFTNDLFPRSRQHPEQFSRTLVRDGASIGANATILAGITIGARAMVGAGAVVTRSHRRRQSRARDGMGGLSGCPGLLGCPDASRRPDEPAVARAGRARRAPRSAPTDRRRARVPLVRTDRSAPALPAAAILPHRRRAGRLASWRARAPRARAVRRLRRGVVPSRDR